MTETPPGQVRPESAWPGRWESITSRGYWAAIETAGGLEALTVASSATRPGGADYVYTAWAVRGADVPLVASAMEGCGQAYYGPYDGCTAGQHTFWRFIHEEDTDA